MRYECTVLGADGRSASAVLDARDEQELHESLREKGELLLKAKAIGEGAAGPVGVEAASSLSMVHADHVQEGALAASRIKLGAKNLLSFSQSMQTSLESGVPVLTTLEALIEQEPDKRTRRVYESLVQSVTQGDPLANALRQHPRSFDDFYCSLVASGEESGSLDLAFSALADFIEWREGLRTTARHALIYPSIVLAAAYGLVLFLLSFVIPRLAGILSKVSDDLPAASRGLISISNFVASNVVFVILGTFALLAALWMMAKTDRGRMTLSTILVKVPIIRKIVETLNLSQACRNMNVLLGSGVTIHHCLELTQSSLTLERLREGFATVREKIMEGTSLTEAMSEEKVLPPLALSMLRIGEESGGLPLAFQRLSTKYEREAKGAVAKAISMLEPAITIALGVIIGTVAAIIITTLYSAMRGLGQ